MSGFLQLLKENRNYRYTWAGQVVSERPRTIKMAMRRCIVGSLRGGIAASMDLGARRG